MTSHAIILGSGSDIGAALRERLIRDDWRVSAYRHVDPVPPVPWDLIVCCYGALEPIGTIWDADADAWDWSFAVNLFMPVRQVRRLYPHARPGASVCFFSGAGTSGPAPTYSAYAAAKVALVKMTELMDDESPDCKFFILGPGMVRTKIHQQTLNAVDRAANIDRVMDFVVNDKSGTSMDDIYACLMACVAARKEAIGGRNIYVPGDDWTRLEALARDPHRFKLRRQGDNSLRRRVKPSERLLLLKDGSRREFSDEEMQRMRFPETDADYALRLSLRKSQRPRVENGGEEWRKKARVWGGS